MPLQRLVAPQNLTCPRPPLAVLPQAPLSVVGPQQEEVTAVVHRLQKLIRAGGPSAEREGPAGLRQPVSEQQAVELARREPELSLVQEKQPAALKIQVQERQGLSEVAPAEEVRHSAQAALWHTWGNSPFCRKKYPEHESERCSTGS